MSEVAERAKEKSEEATSEWDVLRPENNDIGEFDDTNIESDVSARKGAEVSKETDGEIQQTAQNTAGLEAEPIMIDAHFARHAWNLGNTTPLVCNVLDEQWLPDLDDSRPDEMTIEERFKELRERTQFLDEYEKYQREPNPDDDWKFKDINRTIEDFRKNYLNVLEYQQTNPDEPHIDIAVKNTHNWLVMARTYKYLLANPEYQRKEIAYERAGLSQVLAARDERHGEAFTDVDEKDIQQRLNKILDKIPKRDFRTLGI